MVIASSESTAKMQIYPHSGVSIGRVAGALRLKSVLYQLVAEDSHDANSDPDYRPLGAYFAGERIKPERIADAIKKLVAHCVPSDLRWHPEHGDLGLVATLVQMVVEVEAQHWDKTVVRLNMQRHPQESQGDAIYSALRPFAWDIGIRLGAYFALRKLQGHGEPNWESLRIDDGSLGRWIDDRRKRLGLSYTAIVARLQKVEKEPGDGRRTRRKGRSFSPSTLDGWRKGSLPQERHLLDLAQVLTCPGEDPQVVQLQLRLLVGLIDLRKSLVQAEDGLCNADRFDDLIAGVLCAARHTLAWCQRPAQPAPLVSYDLADVARQVQIERTVDKWLPPLLVRLMFQGAACDMGENIAQYLAQVARHRPQVALDLRNLSGAWGLRIGFWRQHVTRHQAILRRIQSGDDFSADFDRHAAAYYYAELLERDTRMADFGRPLEPPTAVAVAVDPSSPYLRARELTKTATVAYSEQNYDTVYACLTEALRLDPDDAGNHFKLGFELLRRGKANEDATMVEDALDHMRRALALDPVDPDYCTQYGAVLTSLLRFSEARDWLESVKDYCADAPSFWSARGKLLLALDDYREAESSFRRALDLAPKEPDATQMLAVALMAQGQVRQAREIAKDAKHYLRWDPTEHWREIVSFFKGERHAADKA